MSVEIANGSYGTCPKCGAQGIQRERRMNGNDVCVNGHMYPSKDAVNATTAAGRPKQCRCGHNIHMGGYGPCGTPGCVCTSYKP